MTHTDRSIRTTENALADLLKCLGDEGYEACLSLIAEHLEERNVWIARDKLAEEMGLSPHVLRGWCQVHLVKGVHYEVIGRVTLMDRREVNRWIESQRESTDTARGSASSLDSKAKDTGKLIKGPATLNT